MDAHKLKHYKNKKKVFKSAGNNGDAEVYVLPPDLLQKLGINLGTVNSDLQPTLDATAKSDVCDLEQTKLAQSKISCNSDKTISETASLLKESMLIMGSPTLTSSVTRIAGEIEISNEAVAVNNASRVIYNATGKSEINGKTHQNHLDILVNADLKGKHVNGSDHKVFTDNLREKIFYGDPTDVMKEQLTATEHSLEEDKDENKNYYESTDGNKKMLKDKIRNMVINKYTSIKETDTKDHDVTKSTNDCNNGNVETMACSDDLLNVPKLDTFKISCHSTTSKISIISEEIVDCSKLRELKKKHSQNVVDLTPVTIKTLITAKKTDDSKNTQQSNTLLGIGTCSEESHKLNNGRNTQSLTTLAINELNGKNPDKCNALDYASCSLVTNVNNSTNLPRACLPNGLNTNSLDAQLNTFDAEGMEKMSSDDSGLIKKCNKIELSPRNISRVSDEETNSNNFTQNEYNEPIIVYSKNTTNIDQHIITVKSKISVQGVEKPGGEQDRRKQSENIPKITKTYQKRKILIKPLIHNITTKSTNNVVNLAQEERSTEIDEVVNHAESEYQGFCICEDFGNLHFYDDDSEYEHIHFWKRDSTYVDPELIFSMYDNEQCNICPDGELICTNMSSEGDCNESLKFCWNEYLFEDSVKTIVNDNSSSSYDIQHTEKICNRTPALINDESRAATAETLTNNDENKPSTQKQSKEPSDILDSCNSNTNNMIEDGMALLKNVSLITTDGSKTTESHKELSSVHNNKDASDPLPEQIDKDVEIPIPKRRRGRPRKIKPIISDVTPESTEHCKESSDGKEDSKKNAMSPSNNNDFERSSKLSERSSITSTDIPAKDQNIMIEETSQSDRKRTQSTNVTAEVSEDANDELARPSRSCARRLNRINSSHSTSTCNDDNIIQDTSENDESDVQCGVCNEVIKASDWIVHIAKEHDYLAWKDGSKPLNLNDELEVKNHLQNILKKIPALVCYTCGIRRKYITSYLKHKSTCEPTDINISLDGTVDPDESNVSLDTSKMNVSLKDCHDTVRCGVCKEEVKGTDWIRHIQREHNYLAWVDGETPLESSEASAEILVNNGEYESSSLKQLKKASDILESSNSNTNKIIEVDTALSKNVPLITMGGSKTTESPKELSSVHNNKDASDPLPEQIDKDVEIPIPKRRRGRPRKIKPIISDVTPESTEHCKVSESSNANRSLSNNNDTPAKDQNIMIEETSQSGRKRTRGTNVTAEVSEDANDELARPSRSCARRLNRINSSHSTSTCNDDNIIQDTSENDESDVQCGVCNEVIKSSDWIAHIAKEHDYLAWKDGSNSLDLNDELEVKNHLQNILKKIPALVCYTCGIRRKYITSYLKHKSTCEPTDINISLDGTVDPDESNVSLDTSKMNVSLKDCHDTVRCGVCKEEVKGTDWIRHIQREHNYLAWVDGETPLSLEDASEVQKYLICLAKKLGGLTCHKCGLVRKYPNIYLQHVKTCEAVGMAAFDYETQLFPEGYKVRCAVCSEEVTPQEWKNHAMRKHYNIAWIVGAPPIDVKNYYAVESYLKEYKNRHNKLVCRICRDSKISYCGFYAHVIQCGKTEEEVDEYRQLCDICNKKYLCMYKSQHMKMHREKENAMERKLKLAEAREQSEQVQDTSMETTGRRKAAEKARTVIAKYKDECQLNRQNGDPDASTGYSSDSDVSVKLEQYTDDESDDSDEQDDISEDEHMDIYKRKRRVADSNAPTITRIPFPIKNVRSYIHDSFEDFCNNHLTRDKLFVEWSDCEYQKLSEDQIENYMPTLKESCKVKFSREGWTTYKRFQVENNDDCTILFVGASVECVSWVPVNLDDVNGDAGNFLAVACHSGTDSPRYNCDEAPEHSNLLQIWDFGDLQSSTPKLALGLAHDYGTVWAMDWCPSGVRDVFKEDDDSRANKRLGLLLIACSNGSAYIFSVPYPSAITVNNEIFYKIKPVAELRLSSMIAEKRKCQATSLRWSFQKGHNIIMVGYSNGIVAYFDLSNDSPLLVVKENGITIIHPFYDERSHNSCVTGVDLYACGVGACGRGGVSCSSSASGARVSTGEVSPARAATLLSSLACAGAAFLPHWPSAVLTAINSKVNQTVNEVEWQSVDGARSGRRVGGVRACAPCVRCGALAAADDPLLTVLHAHPAHLAHYNNNNNSTREHHDIHKHVAAILQMTSLAQKRKQTNDELSMKLEPLTYDDAVQKYGIELELVPKRNKVCQQKALSIPMQHYPERFPLAEITSMSFCPTAMFHNKLAVGTHAGILFLIDA